MSFFPPYLPPSLPVFLQMSPVRPLESIFHPALFLSLLGQFAIHLFCMWYTVDMTKPYLPASWVVSAVLLIRWLSDIHRSPPATAQSGRHV